VISHNIVLPFLTLGKRVKRIYAQYREAVGEWDEALTIYNDMIKENPESTFPRKRKIAM